MRYVVPAALLALVLGGCGGDQPRGSPADRTRTASPSDPGPSSTAPSTPRSTGPAPSTPVPTGGSSTAPTALTATTDVLDWTPVPGPVADDVTRSGDWTLTVRRGGGQATLSGPGGATTTSARGMRVSDALIDDDWAVVVLQDRAEQRPSRAHVTELATGDTFDIDGGSDVPTTSGGTWALGEDRLVHATVSRGAYCLASVDLRSRTSAVDWCAPRRSGFNDARITPAGTSMLTFDDSQPSCRTVVGVGDDEVEPFPGVPDCKGWDGLLLDGGAIWSIVPREHQVEDAHFYARDGDGYYNLGPGSSGTLAWCAGAAYFVRDPQHDRDPAQLMRWTPDRGLAVVYRSPAGQAFLTEPRCGGDRLTVTALAQGGDEQVSARLS